MESSMTIEQAYAYLAAKDRWITLSTIGPDGFPHSVALGYFLIGERVVMGCRDGTQKVRNIERNSKVSLLWESGRDAAEMIGVMLRGHATILRSEQERLSLKQEACRQRGETAPQTMAPGLVYIEVRPEKTTLWKRPRKRAVPNSTI